MPSSSPGGDDESACAGQAQFREAISDILVERSDILSAWDDYVEWMGDDSVQYPWEVGPGILEEIWEQCEDHEERVADIPRPPAVRQAMERYEASMDEFMRGVAHHYEYYIKGNEVYQGLGDFFMERSDRLYGGFKRAMDDFGKLCPENSCP